MTIFNYRYRPIHAITEMLAAFAVRLLPQRKARVAELRPNRILVIKFGGLGEAVLARSIADKLLERNPELVIDYLVEDRTEDVMTLGRKSSRVFRYSPSVNGLKIALQILLSVRRQRYDAIVDFEQHSLLTSVFCRATSIPIRIGFIPSGESNRWRMFTHTIPLHEGDSMWSAFIQLGQVLDCGLSQSAMTAPLPISSHTEDWLEEWWPIHVGSDAANLVVAIHLGVGPSAQYRCWPIRRFADFAKAFGTIHPSVTVLLTGSANERPLMQEFKELFTGKVIEAVDLGGLERTCALLCRCDLLVSADTGIMHLAAAMGVPTVGLFGPNTPACWAPVGPRATYVYTSRQACSPCINSYRRHIPENCTAEKQSACMWDISVEDVLQATRRVMRNTALIPFDRILTK